MRILSLAAVALGVVAAPLAAQTKPDFSGNWKLNKEQSDPPGMGGGMGRPGQSANPPADVSLFVTQMETKLSIEEKRGDQSRRLTFYLDGRESSNPGMRGQEMKTTSRWAGDTLVTEGENTFTGPMGEMKVKSKELRFLTAEGTTFIVTGGGGQVLYPLISGCSAPEMRVGVAKHHFTGIEVYSDRMAITAVATDGSVIDRVEIPAALPTP